MDVVSENEVHGKLRDPAVEVGKKQFTVVSTKRCHFKPSDELVDMGDWCGPVWCNDHLKPDRAQWKLLLVLFMC